MKFSARKRTLAVSMALLSAGISTGVQASGFALIDNSASGMGNAFAGGSAIAEDASTIYFNPAGMTRLSGDQISVAGHFISPAADFTNNGSTLVTGAPMSGTNDDGGESALVPNFYYVKDLGNGNFFGLGITVPFGLSTDYEDDWVGRYTATKSEVSTVNINPSFASKINNDLSIGFGISLQYIEATLANQLDSGMICTGVLVQGGAATSTAMATCAGAGGMAVGDVNVDSSQSLEGDNWATGWNFGLLYDLDKDSRLGLAYRSAIKQDLDGDVNFTRSAELEAFLNGTSPIGSVGPAANAFSNTRPGVEAGIELPASLSVSYYRDIDSKLAIMADITWTEWSNFDQLEIRFDNGPYQSASVIPENWDDAYRFALGMSYKQDSTFTYRAGVAVDQTPIPSAVDRTPRIPGDDRTWLSLGLGYNVSADMSIDVGYSHLFVGDTEINNTDASFGHTVTGSYEADVDILSVQGNFKF
ncbi:MAG: outer membrane protein transport protein [Gammaproteobacteria bacterium]|nr:outer membrane protein transport protein [Gammaproteobacteria bacterium]